MLAGPSSPKIERHQGEGVPYGALMDKTYSWTQGRRQLDHGKALKMDLSRAQLEAFRGLHYFHENLNIHIKSSTAGVILLADAAGTNANPRLVGELIERSHPAWSSSPVHQLDLDLYKRIYCSIGAYAIVALFSALDDFLVGLEADISRCEAQGRIVPKQPKAADDEQVEPIESIYRRYLWQSNEIAKLLPVLKYFRLVRNCIAHRSSRASHALVSHSQDQEFQVSIKVMLDRTTKFAPTYDYNDEIFVDPALAICCSDTIRKIAGDCNRQYLGLIGIEGFLLLVCQNLQNPQRCSTSAYKSPEAVLNLALIERYRVGLTDKYDAPRELQRLGLWKGFYRSFQKNYKARESLSPIHSNRSP